MNPSPRDAYEVSFSSRRVGDEKVRGGYTPDSTGERASCECGGMILTTKTGEEEMVGGHAAGNPYIRKATAEVVDRATTLLRESKVDLLGPLSAAKNPVKRASETWDALDAIDSTLVRYLKLRNDAEQLAAEVLTYQASTEDLTA